MICVDINVLLDVLQRREPHYRASSAVLERVVAGRVEAALPAHAFTTIHYLVGRYSDQARADSVIDWLLKNFSVLRVDRNTVIRARSLAGEDFEDMVLAASAEEAGCDYLVTRNVRDFRQSPVPALTPDEYLLNQPPEYRIQETD